MEKEIERKTAAEIIAFLEKIGIGVEWTTLSDATFLPGIKIERNTLLVDKEKLQYPGDLLHEAGHIAVTEGSERELIGTEKMCNEWPKDGDELAAILWSYAALTYLNFKPEVVFHPDGYKNEAEWLIEQFAKNNYIGLPLLEWMGFCDNETAFPNVKKWMR